MAVCDAGTFGFHDDSRIIAPIVNLRFGTSPANITARKPELNRQRSEQPRPDVQQRNNAPNASEQTRRELATIAVQPSKFLNQFGLSPLL